MQIKLDQEPNKASITWIHDGEEYFDPRSDVDIYLCRATNPYHSAVREIYIPTELTPNGSKMF